MTASSEVSASGAPAPLDERWRANAHRLQTDALPEGRVVVSCPAPLDGGGLGRHLREILDALERGGRPNTCLRRSSALRVAGAAATASNASSWPPAGGRRCRPRWRASRAGGCGPRASTSTAPQRDAYPRQITCSPSTARPWRSWTGLPGRGIRRGPWCPPPRTCARCSPATSSLTASTRSSARGSHGCCAATSRSTGGPSASSSRRSTSASPSCARATTRRRLQQFPLTPHPRYAPPQPGEESLLDVRHRLRRRPAGGQGRPAAAGCGRAAGAQ